MTAPDPRPHVRWLATFADRCDGCGHHVASQGCACNGTLKFAPGEQGKAQGQSAALAAHPTEAARVEDAIRQLAATGKPFSANDARAIHGARGGVVGATFTALRQSQVIRRIGSEASTKANTHAHHVGLWIGAAA